SLRHNNRHEINGRRGAGTRRRPTASTGASAGRSLSLEENYDLRGAETPWTRHREAADDPPALGRIAVERLLEALWSELAATPAVLLRPHLVFHGLSTSSSDAVPRTALVSRASAVVAAALHERDGHLQSVRRTDRMLRSRATAASSDPHSRSVVRSRGGDLV